MKKPLVSNAVSEKQIAKAKHIENERSRSEAIDLIKVLDSKEGRRVLWRILERCRVFSSVYSEGSMIHYKSGQQDIGHYLLSEIVKVSEDHLFLMMTENREQFYQKDRGKSERKGSDDID